MAIKKRGNGKDSNSKGAKRTAEAYRHREAENLLRPEIGVQAQFKKRKPPVTYRFDSSLAPELQWDGQNQSREFGEWLLNTISDAAALSAPHQFDKPRILADATGREYATVSGLADAVEQLRRLGKPFLNWAGKAERLSFEVPTLPLFVHERLSTKAIIETLQGHKADRQLELDLFGDPHHSITDQVLRAYEHRDKWVNRMILGDSLVVMNSLLHFEGLGGQVQMIYMDPPYGVSFGSNFQPFVRKRDVTHNDDEDMTREPETVKAYRDTWELGLHSYLTYMRDRLLLARELLAPTGSIFVQISDENLHHVREVLDETFGGDNFVSIIAYTTSGGFTSATLSRAGDYLIWFCKEKSRLKYNKIFREKGPPIGEEDSKYDQVELPDGLRRPLTLSEKAGIDALPAAARVYRIDNLISSGFRQKTTVDYEFEGRRYHPGPENNWKASVPEGMDRLAAAKRIIVTGGGKLGYLRYWNDFPLVSLTNMWSDIGGTVQSRTDSKIYVVQTGRSVLERCMHMTTDPGDLVLDPTCGSGTTAYVAEQWGRRWITIDTSRVPLALARQRLLTATFPYYRLKEEPRGPAGGFVYIRKQNSKGEEIGGIVPHITLKSIANDESPDEEVLVDRPEVDGRITRVTGPFCVEATIPTPADWEDTSSSGAVSAMDGATDYGSFVERMLEVLRRSPVLQLGMGKTVMLKNIRQPAKTLHLSAEATVVNGDEQTVALVFGPENGAVSERLVNRAALEASSKGYSHLYVIGFAIQPNARELVEHCDAVMNIPATYVQATPDLIMGDLLKHMRSSQIFSVCGLPEIKILKSKKNGTPQYQVELLGLDVFDPVEMETIHRKGDDVPVWFLDTDYNGLCFHVTQAFFPRTAAWDNLRKALKGTYEESVWDHLAGTISAPFETGEHGEVAVKVIDDRGNELMVVKQLSGA